MNAVLGMMPPRRDRYVEALEAFARLPFFPNASTWKEFIAPYHNVADEVPFAITLQKGPGPEFEMVFGTSGGQIAEFRFLECTFFGVLSRRIDGKLGRLCFGQETEDFGGNTTGRTSIFVHDGFTAEFLKVKRKDIFFSIGSLYKVTTMDTRFESVMKKLARNLERIVGDEKECPNEVCAANLAKLNEQLSEFFPLCGTIGQGINLELITRALNARIGLRVQRLEKEAALLKEQLFEKDREIKKLTSVATKKQTKEPALKQA